MSPHDAGNEAVSLDKSTFFPTIPGKSALICASGFILTAIASPAATRVLQAFEGNRFDDWKLAGTAFGQAPVAGSCEGLTAELSKYSGESLAAPRQGWGAIVSGWQG